jgi:L-ascorbate 6-phosphate lactonase
MLGDDLMKTRVVFNHHYRRKMFPTPPLSLAVARKPLIALGVPDDRIMTVSVDQSHKIGDITFTNIPAAHESLDYDPDNGYPYQGYVITIGRVNLYHAGDCVPYEGLVERLKAMNIDIALLPINGRDYFRLKRGFAGNFTYREAAELTDAIGADLLIPMHFGMHMANTECPGLLVDYLTSNFPRQKFHIMRLGERLLYFKTDDGLSVVSAACKPAEKNVK